MHRLSLVIIENFRACRLVSFPIDAFTPLVGQNNTGKSTILEAIKWVLKPSALSQGDFADAGQPIVVVAKIEGITPELLDKIPEKKHRTAIEPYCKDGTLWIRACAESSGKKPLQQVWEPEEYAGKSPEKWRDYPTGLPQAVSVLLPEALHIEAMEDIGEDLGKAKAGTTIKALLDEIMIPVLKAHDDLNNALDTIRGILTADGANRSGHLKAFDSEATTALEHFFPGLELDLDLQVIDVKEFFKAGDLHVTDKQTGDRRRFDLMGTGAQRAIQMALIRYLAEIRKQETDGLARRMLLVDEPELYLHPKAIVRLRQALYALSQAGFQVVFSTHSPMMLSRENAADTIIVSKSKEDGTTTRLPLGAAVKSAFADAGSQSRTLFELGNLAEIYFADKIVLCEGKTDRRLLSLAYERFYGQPMEVDRISVVSLGACSDIPKAILVLKAMGATVCAVADLDFAFTHARKGTPALLEKDGADIQQAKQVLSRMQATTPFPLENGLPTKDKKTGWHAADTWAAFAKDDEGKTIALSVHDSLRKMSIWIWPEGCIEQVTGETDKGEDAIIKQEAALLQMSSQEIEQQMPAFKACFEWIRNY